MFGLYKSKKTGSLYRYGGLLCRPRGVSRQHVERSDSTGQQLALYFLILVQYEMLILNVFDTVLGILVIWEGRN